MVITDVKKGKSVPLSKVYTKSSISKLMNCSPTWVNELIKKGELIPIKVNGKELVCRAVDFC